MSIPVAKDYIKKFEKMGFGMSIHLFRAVNKAPNE